MRTSLYSSVFVMVVAAGCSKRSDAPPAPPPTPPAPAAPDPSASVSPDELPLVPGTTASNIDLSKLGSILVAQKAKRGTGPGPSTDQVYAAVEKLGMTLDQRQQILANSSGANYCELAHAGELVIVVCEYGADKDASTALASINEKWAQLNSTLVRTAHKSSILTVVHGGNRVAAVDKVIAAFNTL